MNVISLAKKNIISKSAALVFIFSISMVFAAYIRIPLFFTPVPFTLQTFVLYLSLITLGRKAFFAQAAYLLMGIIGLPVFTNAGSGLLYFTGPTAGYLFGFLIVAASFPIFIPKQNNLFKSLCYFSLAAVCLYFSGAAWLVCIYKFSLPAVFAAGIMPFVLSEIFKIGLASFILLRVNNHAIKAKNN